MLLDSNILILYNMLSLLILSSCLVLFGHLLHLFTVAAYLHSQLYLQTSWGRAVPSSVTALKALPAKFILWRVVGWVANCDYIAKPQLSWAWQFTTLDWYILGVTNPKNGWSENCCSFYSFLIYSIFSWKAR